VLDPFFGAGTVGVVAEKYHRDWVGIEINPFYARLARKRIASGRASSGAVDERHAA
jgi:DNA modification methylase